MNTALRRMIPGFIFLVSVITAQCETFKFNLTFIVKNDTITLKKSTSLTDYLITYKVADKKNEDLAPIKKEKGFRLDLEFNKEYIFTFSKPGYVIQRIVINTTIPDRRDNEKFRKMLCLVNLERAPIEFIIANAKPVKRINYNITKKEFAYDASYLFTSMDVEVIKKRDKIFNKGWWQFHNGNYKEALATFADLIQKNPQDVASLYNHGKAALKLNNKKAACADWNAIKALNKDYANDLLRDYCTDK